MLVSDVAHRNLFAFAVDDGDTKDALAQENSFGMVPKSAMSEIGKESLGLIKPVMNGQVVIDCAAEFAGAAPSVLQWVCRT